MRGLIPAPWTFIPPPPSAESILGGNLLGGSVCEGCLGAGTTQAPLVLFGDASGGRDTHDPRLRRVGLAVAHLHCYDPPTLGPHIMGPLPGASQSVPRGELLALLWALRYSVGVLIYVTDCSEVARGWYAELFRRPEGPQADLWRMVGQLLLDQARHPTCIVIMQVPSHLSAREFIARGIPSWLVVGNACVDALTGESAA